MTPTLLVLDRVRIARPGAPAVPGAVVVECGRIRWIGPGSPPSSDLAHGRRGAPRRIDCGGAFLFPGFVDAHCHPLALGAALTAADCRPPAIRSIRQIQEAIRRWAAENRHAQWVRAFGYDELLLEERRHPDRHDLDAAEAQRPVALTHGSGHALVLNTAGLQAAGVDESTEEPPGCFIDREPSTGAPSGVLYEMSEFVARKTGGRAGDEPRARPESEAARRYASAASDALVRAGVTAVVDAGPSNDLSTLELWAGLRRTGAFIPAMTMMRSPDARIPESAIAELGELVMPGHVKVMVTLSGGRQTPDQQRLEQIVEGGLASGAGVAIHAVEAAAILAACRAFERVATSLGGARRHDSSPAIAASTSMRIEHAAESPPEVCLAIKRLGASVATQPGFIVGRGDRYFAAARLGGPSLEHLYSLRTLLDTGVPVLGSSDAPYGPVSPLEAVYGAVARMSQSGEPVGRSQAIGVEQALGLYSSAAPGAGDRADLVLLSRDPRDVPEDRLQEIRAIRVVATVVAGEPAWLAL